MEILILYLYIFVFGLIVGSFLNCLIWRLHTGEGLWDRSHCPKCNQKIAWYDNIPVLSYLLLGAKCRHCNKNISWQYPVVELATGLLFVMSYYLNLESLITNNGLNFIIHDSKFMIQQLESFFIIAVMIIIFIYDLRWYLILDKITIPSIIIIFITNLVLGVSWSIMLLAMVVGGGFFLLQFVVSRGKWIGGGDIRLGALMGVILGWPNILAALMISYVIGSVIGIGLMMFGKKKWSSEVPMGVFLTTGTLIVMFYGGKLISWYLNILT